MKISIFKSFPPCGGDVGIAERENKAENVQKIHFPVCGFKAQQKKMQRIMGSCVCTGALWDCVVLLPVTTRDSLFYSLKEWFDAQISRILPDVFSYNLDGVCVI